MLGQAHRPLSSGMIVALILLVFGAFPLLSVSSAAQANRDVEDNGACIIRKDDPLKVDLRAGEVVRATCTNGVLTVKTHKVRDSKRNSGRKNRVGIMAADEPDTFEQDVPGHNPPDEPPLEGADRIKATCNVRSTLWDNSAFDIEMTRYTLYLAWVRKNSSKIVRLGRAWAGWKYEQKTGWYPKSGAVFLYAKTRNNNGKWIKQGMEGWKEFNGINEMYPHEHRSILWVTRDGACYGEDHFSGIVPNFSYQEWRTYKTGYTPKR